MPSTEPGRPTELTSRLLRKWALPEPGSSKYARGRVLVVGGAARTPGAVRIPALAAVALAVATPEASVAGLEADASGSVLPDRIPALAGELASAAAGTESGRATRSRSMPTCWAPTSGEPHAAELAVRAARGRVDGDLRGLPASARIAGIQAGRSTAQRDSGRVHCCDLVTASARDDRGWVGIGMP